MADEKTQAAVLAQLAETMKRWGIKPEQLKSPYRELMAFTPEETVTDEPKPLTDEELGDLEASLRGVQAAGAMGGAGPSLLSLVAEVRRVRELVLRLETCGRRNPGCCMGHALLDATGQDEPKD